jgi:hypothetical protein
MLKYGEIMKNRYLIFLIFLFLISCDTFHYEVKKNKVIYHFLEGAGLYYWTTKEVNIIDPKSLIHYKNKRYAKDKNSVFFDGFIIEKADLNTFETIFLAGVSEDNLAKDKNYVFRANKIWEGVDPESFEILKPYYYKKDKNHVYIGKYIIKNANPKTFKVIYGNYSKDDKDVYYQTSPLYVSNINSFRILFGKEFDWWSKDNFSYYYCGRKVPIADYDSFQILSGGFSKDKDNVYYGDKIFIEADAKTFRMIPGKFVGKDKNGYYNLTGKISYNE